MASFLLKPEEELRVSMTEDALPQAPSAPVSVSAPMKTTTPAMPGAKSDLAPGVPSSKRQSWGAVLSIIVIMLMIIIGAFYTWGKRIAEQNQIPAGFTP